ncbi:hypothetical protein LTR53_011224, partial [Teratosphaeriaceae sp. CCFEE 6253]
MAAVAGHDPGRTVSPIASSSLLRSPRSPDTASHVYPERAIRPLPRSRLKSRLSPEQASHLAYPPDHPPALASPSPHAAAPGTSPGPDAEHRGPTNNGVRAVHAAYADHVHAHAHAHAHGPDPHYRARGHRDGDGEGGHCTCGEDGESGDEEVEFDHPDYRYTAATAAAAAGPGTPTPAGPAYHAQANGAGKAPLDSVQRRLMEAARLAHTGGGAGSRLPPPPTTASTTSSADGYESFENTSNKKKRKIPLSGASSTLHPSSLSAEMASMGISGQSDGAGDDGRGSGAAAGQSLPPHAVTQGAASAAGTGISGAGRGRYGRTGNGHALKNGLRRPMGNGVGNAGLGGQGVVRSGGDGRNGDGTDDLSNTGGIISQAIKSAAEQGPLTPHRQQQQQQRQKPSSTPGKSPSRNPSLLQSATPPAAAASTSTSTTTPKT